MTAAAVILILAGLVALVVIATVVPFGVQGLALFAAFAVIALASSGERR